MIGSCRARLGLVWLLMLAPAQSILAAEIADTWIGGVYTGKSPRPVALAEPAAWQQANEIAVRTPGAFVLVGTGGSMQPLYRPGTILVLQRIAYTRLECGQTVIYRNQARRAVAHVLVAKVRDGWRITGLNTSWHDMEPVLPDNLIGVVIAAFQPIGEPGPRFAAH
ncbi:MAG: S24/S26 family peptidase [Opitutae bacterium]|nr:S24/S26 family peptidase [Opitutae bacterium]